MKNIVPTGEKPLDLPNLKQPAVYEIVQYKGNTFIQRFAYMLIRPPAFRYNNFLLNPSKKAGRFLLQNHQLPEFELSLYLPVQKQVEYVVLYLHGNASSRLQGALMINLFPQKVALACFDFKGCGNRSEKDKSNSHEYLTLGKNQSKQVDEAAKYLKQLGYKVVGWGRSMGAISLLLSTQIQIMIVDSPYSSLGKLCRQSQQKVIPRYLSCFTVCFFQCIFDKVSQKVYQLSGMRLQQMQITQKIKLNSQDRQICFIHGENDNLVNFQHSQQLYQLFQGRKQYILFQGTHNGNRSFQVMNACIQFIDESLKNVKLKELEKKSKLLFVRQKSQKRVTQKKIEALNSLKKNKKNIVFPKLQNSFREVRKKQKNEHKQKQPQKICNNLISKDCQTNQIRIQLLPMTQTPKTSFQTQGFQVISQLRYNHDENCNETTQKRSIYASTQQFVKLQTVKKKVQQNNQQKGQ